MFTNCVNQASCAMATVIAAQEARLEFLCPSPNSMPRVLCVDDLHELLEIYSQTLRTAGHEVAVASTPDEALGAVRLDQFDVAIIDCLLGSASGVETARQIRRMQPDIKIILSTGSLAPEELPTDEFPVHEKGAGSADLAKLVNEVLRGTPTGPSPTRENV
jgi:CheY-like chemotaxis protein